MIIQFHTPRGIVNVDSLTVTDKELSEINITREDLERVIPRNICAELDTLKDEITRIKIGG